MQAVKWVVAKLQGDKTASFCREMSGREVTGSLSNQHPSLPWNFITHGFLDPSAFPDPQRILLGRAAAKQSVKVAESRRWSQELHVAL